MKSYPPIKRHQSLVSLSKDHHDGLLLIWKIRQGLNKAVDAERVSLYVLSFYKTHLKKHFEDEEKFLFCRMAENDLLRKRAEAEHQTIYKQIVVIESEQNNFTLLIQFADELEKHIRFEERELFDYLQNNLGAEELAEIETIFSNNSKEEMINGMIYFGKK